MGRAVDATAGKWRWSVPVPARILYGCTVYTKVQESGGTIVIRLNRRIARALVYLLFLLSFLFSSWSLFVAVVDSRYHGARWIGRLAVVVRSLLESMDSTCERTVLTLEE
jgi:hypothetical protein